MTNQTLEDVIKDIGIPAVAVVCGVSQRAIYKWISKGALPRTDFCGETNYAANIAKLSGGKYSKKQILVISKQAFSADN